MVITGLQADRAIRALLRWRIPANRTVGASRSSGGAAGEVSRGTTVPDATGDRFRGPRPCDRHSRAPCPVCLARRDSRGALADRAQRYVGVQARPAGSGAGLPRCGGVRSDDRGAGRLAGTGCRRAPGTLRYDYAGAAWYRRTVAVPVLAWQVGDVAHRRRAPRDDAVRQRAAHRRAPGVQRAVHLRRDRAVRPGGENVIALRIANPGGVPLEGPREQKPVRPTGMLNYIGNWGGIYGNVELYATERTSIDRVYVRPDVERRTANSSYPCRTATSRITRANCV